jgi:peptidoglycan hydrolase CwlO-like protein
MFSILQIKQYRAIIVSLKEEFIKSEEERAVNEMGAKVASEQHVVGGAEMESLRSQVSALRDGLRQAKTDLDSARAGREKLVKARQAALEEGERLEGQVSRAEAQASAAQEALHRCRRWEVCYAMLK